MAFQSRLYRASVGLLGLFAMVGGTGCSSTGGFGVTPGGAQDMRLAREIIDGGGIPTADQFTAEGLFSEHDLPLPGGSCDADLCPRATAALIEPVDGRGSHALVHLGFATRHGDDYQRPALNLGVAVDVSGSMSGSKIESVRTALHSMVDQLDADDRLALVKFDGTATRILAPRMMDAGGRSAAHSKIDKLRAGGGTDIEAGLRRATTQVEANLGSGGTEDRVMLFTDAQPNIGATGTDSFLGLVQDAAGDGIGLSVFGVGLDLGAELATRISEVRGGNSFYLSDSEAIATVFDEEFDMIVSPVAYDLEFSLQPNELFSFADAFGVPDASESAGVDFSVATAFLSTRGGGMAALLDGPIELPPGGEEGVAIDVPLGTLSVSYETVDGVHVDEQVDVRWHGGSAVEDGVVHADHLGVAKLAVLVDEYLALRAAAGTCGGVDGAAEDFGLDPESIVLDAAARLRSMAAATAEAPLDEESALMERLAQNLLAGGSCGY